MSVPTAQEQRWLVERVEHSVLPLAVASDPSGALCAVSLHAKDEVIEARAKAAGVDSLERHQGAPRPRPGSGNGRSP